MKTIHVLGHESSVCVPEGQAGDRHVGGIGAARPHSLPPPPVPLPHESRISLEGLRRRECLRPVRPPEAVGTAERGNPGLRAYPRPGKDQDPAGRAQLPARLVYLVKVVHPKRR